MRTIAIDVRSDILEDEDIIPEGVVLIHKHNHYPDEYTRVVISGNDEDLMQFIDNCINTDASSYVIISEESLHIILLMAEATYVASCIMPN